MATVPAFDPATSRRRLALVASNNVFHVCLRAALETMAHAAPDVCLQVITPTDACGEWLDAGEVDPTPR